MPGPHAEVLQHMQTVLQGMDAMKKQMQEQAALLKHIQEGQVAMQAMHARQDTQVADLMQQSRTVERQNTLQHTRAARKQQTESRKTRKELKLTKRGLKTIHKRDKKVPGAGVAKAKHQVKKRLKLQAIASASAAEAGLTAAEEPTGADLTKIAGAHPTTGSADIKICPHYLTEADKTWINSQPGLTVEHPGCKSGDDCPRHTSHNDEISRYNRRRLEKKRANKVASDLALSQWRTGTIHFVNEQSQHGFIHPDMTPKDNRKKKGKTPKQKGIKFNFKAYKEPGGGPQQHMAVRYKLDHNGKITEVRTKVAPGGLSDRPPPPK